MGGGKGEVLKEVVRWDGRNYIRSWG